MRFVTDDQVPVRLRQAALYLFISADLVQARDQAIIFGEGVAAARCFDHVARDDVEIKLEFAAQLILPLLG